MDKLVVFGDSFLDSRNTYSLNSLKPESHQPIASQLSNLLNISIQSYAIGGSSVKYSFRKFLDYITSNEYSTNDVFLICLSSPERYYDFFSDSHLLCYGDSIGNRLKELEKHLRNEKDGSARQIFEEQIFHLKQNKDGINWYLTNGTMHDIFPYDTIGFLSFMKSFCATSTNKLIVTNCFTLEHTDFYKKYFTNTQNFLFLYIEEGLYRLSINEFKNNNSINWEDEMRINHFCPENREIISKMLADVYKTWNVSSFDETKIQSKLFDSMNDIVKKYNCTSYPKGEFNI